MYVLGNERGTSRVLRMAASLEVVGSSQAPSAGGVVWILARMVFWAGGGVSFGVMDVIETTMGDR